MSGEFNQMLRSMVEPAVVATPPAVPPQPVESAFDPSEYTVQTVLDYVADNPGEAAAVLAAEEAGKGRITIIDALR
jgi:hypothetical protein